MALEMGLGITPWSPLKGGALSGKFKRDGKEKPGRGDRITAVLNEKTYALLDTMESISKELGTTVSRLALAWLHSRPGVVSTIIGARTMQQLEDNLGSLDVQPTSAMLQKLDELTTPTLDFPSKFLEYVIQASSGGLTINGKTTPVWPMSPANDGERY